MKNLIINVINEGKYISVHWEHKVSSTYKKLSTSQVEDSNIIALVNSLGHDEYINLDLVRRIEIKLDHNFH